MILTSIAQTESEHFDDSDRKCIFASGARSTKNIKLHEVDLLNIRCKCQRAESLVSKKTRGHLTLKRKLHKSVAWQQWKQNLSDKLILMHRFNLHVLQRQNTVVTFQVFGTRCRNSLKARAFASQQVCESSLLTGPFLRAKFTSRKTNCLQSLSVCYTEKTPAGAPSNSPHLQRHMAVTWSGPPIDISAAMWRHSQVDALAHVEKLHVTCARGRDVLDFSELLGEVSVPRVDRGVLGTTHDGQIRLLTWHVRWRNGDHVTCLGREMENVKVLLHVRRPQLVWQLFVVASGRIWFYFWQRSRQRFYSVAQCNIPLGTLCNHIGHYDASKG